jgi:hypothetical protein
MNSVYAKPFRFLAKRVILIVGFHTISPEDLEFVDRLIETGILFSDVFELPQGRMRGENRKKARPFQVGMEIEHLSALFPQSPNRFGIISLSSLILNC